ncbi:MAG: 5'/3'-nucleotidase SurE [Thermoleophilum sp.]|nr:5'/3'-nucleotidase SurE [Thermoleophilum sp.]
MARILGAVRVLLTNDDGIQATGLHAMRRALLERVPGIELAVIAPDSNRSASARSITTRQPLAVDEVRFADGERGFATDGTPVDCVRFAVLGLVGEPPELIVSGINHGSNLGDDVTYSGTVAAAFEGALLGIPAIAVSQQAEHGRTDFRPRGRGWAYEDFAAGARFVAELVAAIDGLPLGERTVLNVNVPAGEVRGVRVCRLGRRIYRDELKLESVAPNGRKHYRIYGAEPGYHEEPGTDFEAVADSMIAVTPLGFDLNHERALAELGRVDLQAAFARSIERQELAHEG